MLKRKFMLPILAVIVGIAASAFTSTGNSYNTDSQAPSYYWFDPGVTTYHDQNTVLNEQDITGCKQTEQLCENGYTQDQLNDPNDPSQGVRSDQINSPASQIFKN